MSAHERHTEAPRDIRTETPPSWQRPAFDVICLACEISAYAPDEGEPLF